MVTLAIVDPDDWLFYCTVATFGIRQIYHTRFIIHAAQLSHRNMLCTI